MAAGSGRSPRATAPRVQIAYETEADGRRQRKELPFVLGVLGNFSGQPEEPFPKLRDRKFRDVDRTNFDTDGGDASAPGFSRRQTLGGDDSKLAVELRFRSLDDFGPKRSHVRCRRCASSSSCATNWPICCASSTRAGLPAGAERRHGAGDDSD